MLYRSRSFFINVLCTLFLFYSPMSRSTMESPPVFSKIPTTDRRIYITPQASRILKGNQKMWIDSLGIENIAHTDKTTVQKRAMTEKKAEFIWKLVLLIDKVEQETGRPISIPYTVVYAQAALESGWGTSPAARHDQNPFGLRHADGSSMVFASPLDGLKKYLHTLENQPRHEAFRTKLRETNNPLMLTEKLTSYCNCDGYPEKLNKIIQDNHLTESPG